MQNNFIEPNYAHLMVIGVDFFDQKTTSGLLIIPLKSDFAPVRPDNSNQSFFLWDDDPEFLRTF